MKGKAVKVVSWVLAVGGLMMAVGAEGITPRILMIGAAIVFCPITWGLLSRKTGVSLPPGAFIALGMVVTIVGAIVSDRAAQGAFKAQGFATVEDYRQAKGMNLNAEQYAAHLAQQAEIERQAQAEQHARDMECKKSLACWAKKHEAAAIGACRTSIERFAKYDYDWTSGALSPMFSKFKWADAQKGTVVFIGDQIKLQNGLGVFMPHRYACQYDPRTERVADVAVQPGRL